MWRAAGLEEAGSGPKGSSGGGGSSTSGSGSSSRTFTEQDCHLADVDAAKENGFFARWGEPAPQRSGGLAGTHLRNGAPVA